MVEVELVALLEVLLLAELVELVLLVLGTVRLLPYDSS